MLFYEINSQIMKLMSHNKAVFLSKKANFYY
jgi:hypothetical protein